MPAENPSRTAPYRVYITPRRSIIATPDRVARALAAEGLPICPGELDHPGAVPAMLAELRDLGRIFASERVHVTPAERHYANRCQTLRNAR